MARKKIPVEIAEPDIEVNVLATAANEIFKQCFIKANVYYKKPLWDKTLTTAINEGIKDKNRKFKPRYIYNKYTVEILPYLNKEESKHHEVRFYHEHLQTLANYAGVDYRQLNMEFAPTPGKLNYVLRTKKSNIPSVFKEYVPLDGVLQQTKKSFEDNTHRATALFGMPGMGKSMLSFYYATTYRSQYPGGCWYIPAAGKLNFRQRLKEFAKDTWEVEFTDEENKDEELAWQRVKRFLEGPLVLNEKHLTLLVFDNVDEPDESFSDICIDANALDGVNIVITTRISTPVCRNVKWIQVNGLSGSESLTVLKNFRAIDTPDEETAAALIVDQLNGFALALVLIGVRLNIYHEVSYQNILHDLQTDNIHFLDHSGEQIADVPGHYEHRIITKLLLPIIEILPQEYKRALDYIALLPADQIALPWVEKLVKADFATSFPQPKYISDPDNWQILVRKLKSLSLITGTDSPDVVRMHRLLQEVILNMPDEKNQLKKRNRRLINFVAALTDKSVDNTHLSIIKWQIPLIIAFAANKYNSEMLDSNFLSNISILEKDMGNYTVSREWMERVITADEKKYGLGHSILSGRYSNIGMTEAYLGNYNIALKWMQKALAINEKNYEAGHVKMAANYADVGLIEKYLGNYTLAKNWVQKAIAIGEKHLDPLHAELGIYYVYMGMIERYLGNYKIARDWTHKATIIGEKNYGPNHPKLGIHYSHIGNAEMELGNYVLAKSWMEKSLKIAEYNFAPGHPEFGVSYSTMGVIEKYLGNYDTAKTWMKKAIAMDEKNYRSDHPFLGITYSNLAVIEKDIGNFEEAKTWIKKAIVIDEKNYASNHPKLSIDYSNLAVVELKLNNHTEAKAWMKKAMAIDKKNYEPEHPKFGNRYHKLAQIEFAMGNKKLACNLFQKAYKIYYNAMGKDHPDTVACLKDWQDNCPNIQE